MRDFAELVKALRYCNDIDADGGCWGCVYEKRCRDNRMNQKSRIHCAVIEDAADAIEELLSTVPKWISVEERLPETGERVLVSNGGFVCESFLSQSGKWQRGSVDMFFMTPTHWCEMPESPKEENKR